MVQQLDGGKYLCKHFAIEPYEFGCTKYKRLSLHDDLYIALLEKREDIPYIPMWEKLIEAYINIAFIVSLLVSLNSVNSLAVLYIYFTFKYYFYSPKIYTFLVLPILLVCKMAFPLWLLCMIYAEYVVKG